jgi:hypothetical protein
MAQSNPVSRARRLPWRPILWAVPAVLLLLPLVLRFPWTVGDFLFAALAFGIVGLLLELVVRTSDNLFHRAGAGLAIAACFLLVWVNGAVGFFGDEDNPANLVFFGVIAFVLLGAAAARFRPGGMAWVMAAAALAQIVIGIGGYALRVGSPGFAGLYEAAMGTTLFATLWLLSASLLRKAARDGG